MPDRSGTNVSSRWRTHFRLFNRFLLWPLAEFNARAAAAVSTVGFAPIANVQNPDDVRLLIVEANSPVTHAQP